MLGRIKQIISVYQQYFEDTAEEYLEELRKKEAEILRKVDEDVHEGHSHAAPSMRLIDPENAFTFGRAMAQRYQQLDVDQIERIFQQTVTVSYLNTAAWAPNDVLSSRADVTAAILQQYQPPTGEDNVEEEEAEALLL